MSALKELRNLQIPLKEIELAIEKNKTIIGRGGYGEVYKGELSISKKPTTVAIKRLNEQFGQGLKQFLTELQLLSDQKHPNLISLIGYCDEGKEKSIVYEYVERGSLDQYLKGSNTNCSLTWLKRLVICLGAARGLDHLHNHVGKHQTIIHRDIKSSNILIHGDWVAKISDFGLSKLGSAGLQRSAVISEVCGTLAYCEPEYISTSIVTKASDIYSFGIVLFEVLCGRLCFVLGDDQLSLSGPLVKNYYKNNKLHEIVDPSLKEQMSLESMRTFSAIAYKCLHEERKQRPSIDVVVKKLEESLRIQISFDEKKDESNDDEKKHELILAKKCLNLSSTPSIEKSASNFRDAEVEIIIQKICNKDIVGHAVDDVRAFAMWGMEGVGKTTLAQLIYDHERVRTHFELKTWVTVYNELSTFDIITRITESISERSCQGEFFSRVKGRLNDMLQGQRFLIVLDDVWIDDEDTRIEWNRLSKALSCGAQGSILIVTTRSLEMSRIIAKFSELQYQVKGLSQEDSLSLFKNL